MSARTVQTHLVIGERQQVCSALERAYADGRLVCVGPVAELPGRRVQVTADLREPATEAKRWALRIATGVVAAATCSGIVWLLVLALTALVTAVTAAITAALAWLSAHLPVLVLGAVALLVLLCSPGTRCPGLHCGGCRR